MVNIAGKLETSAAPVPTQGKLGRFSLDYFSRKLGKRGAAVILPFVAGIFLVACGALALSYYDKQSQQDDLRYQISLHNTILKKPAPNQNVKQIQEAELAQAQAGLRQAEEYLKALSLPTPAQGIDIYEKIVALGLMTNNQTPVGEVLLSSIKASAPADSGDGSIGIPFSIIVTGSQDALLELVATLIRSQGLLSGVEINRMAIKENGATYSLEMDFDVHTWNVDAPGGQNVAPAPEKSK